MNYKLDRALKSASSVMATANTPLFIVRMLKSEPKIIDLSRCTSTDYIIKSLTRSIKSQPSSLIQEVRPYLMLVLLSIKREREALEHASKLEAPYHDWYFEISNFLKQTTKGFSFNVSGEKNSTSSKTASVKSIRF